MILSPFEQAAAEIRKAGEQRAAQQRAREALTPQHAACEAAVSGPDDEAAAEEAERVQHLADPYAPAPAAPDMDKVFRDAAPGPGAYPAPSAMSPARGPAHPDLTAGHAAPGPGCQLPAAFNVPRATLNAADFCRGPITGGQAAPSPSYLEAP